MNITDKQRAHACRYATQDAPKYAKGRTVTPEKITTYTEYQATISGAPKTEPARTQWKEIYRDTMTAYMINAQHFSPEHEQQERIRLDQGAAQHTSRIAAAVAKMQEPMIVDGQEWETTVPKVQVTKDGPAYLLPGIEPAGEQRGEATQTAMF